MNVKQYRKKPVVIEALLFDGDNYHDIGMWIGGGRYHPDVKKIIIPTLEGNMEASPGDYIIKGVQGEFYPCKPDIFEATYEAVV
jgi:hypothetical protein